MMTLSTLESLEASYSKVQIKWEEKRFGYYDKVNYSDKNFAELKSQLQSHLRLMKASRQCFEEDNHQAKYTMPETFD